VTRAEVEEALEQAGGDLARAAWILGVSRESLRARCRRENLRPEAMDGWVERTRAALRGGDDGRADDR
jgi:DNA-binding NtrC family response regulator